MFCNGAQCQRGEEGQRCKDIDHEYQDDRKRERARAQRAGGFIDKPLLHQGPGNGQLNHNGEIAAKEHQDLP